MVNNKIIENTVFSKTKLCSFIFYKEELRCSKL